MRFRLIYLWLIIGTAACVDPEDILLRGTVDIIVIDGTINNLIEPQVIRLNVSRADRLTGRFGSLPITKAKVEVIVDSLVVIACHETLDGTYQLPSDFKGQVGHAYQLRITLTDDRQYVSSQQVMLGVAPIENAYKSFNPNGLSTKLLGGYTAGHDIFIDTQAPVVGPNYYRWDWTLYERQLWCKSCTGSVYAVNNILFPYQYVHQPGGTYYVSGNQTYEECFTPIRTGLENQPSINNAYFYYDYNCRTQCWQVISSYELNLFSDIYSRGGLIARRKVGTIPFYQHAPCLVDVRQGSLTVDAYRYFKLFQDQTQNTGGLADTPPTLAVGNVHNVANSKEPVIGYFTASAVSVYHLWLDRKDTSGLSLGDTDPAGPQTEDGGELFFALNQRRVHPEPAPPYTGAREVPAILIYGGPSRPPTAICVSKDSRTPFKPEGWRD